MSRKKQFHAFIAVVAALLVTIIFWQHYKLNLKSRESKANQLAFHAMQELPSDPTRSLRLAEQAYRYAPQASAPQRALLSAYYQADAYYDIVATLPPTTHGVEITPQGILIIANDTENNDFSVQWQDYQGHTKQTFSGHTKRISGVALSPDGQKLASISWDGKLILYAPDGQKRWQRHIPGALILSVCFSADGKQILTGDSKGHVRRWGKGGKLLQTLKAHRFDVLAVDFSPKNDKILSVSLDNNVMVHDTTGRRILKLTAPRDKQFFACFSPDGNNILTLRNNTSHHRFKAQLFTPGGKPLNACHGHTDWISFARFSPSGDYLLTASVDKTARLWSANGQLLKTFKGHGSVVWNAGFGPNEDYVYTASNDKTLRKWKITANPMRVLNEDEKPEYDSLFYSSQTELIDLEQNNITHYRGHEDDLQSKSFSPRKKFIVTTGKDKTTRLWDAATGQQIIAFQHQSVPDSAYFTIDGRSVVTAGASGNIVLWMITPKEILYHINEEQKFGKIWQLPQNERSKFGLK